MDGNGKTGKNSSLDRTMRLDGFRTNTMAYHHSDVVFKNNKELNKTIDFTKVFNNMVP